VTVAQLKRSISSVPDDREIFIDVPALDEYVLIDSIKIDSDGDVILSADIQFEAEDEDDDEEDGEE
jgi:hypothetical protein